MPWFKYSQNKIQSENNEDQIINLITKLQSLYSLISSLQEWFGDIKPGGIRRKRDAAKPICSEIARTCLKLANLLYSPATSTSFLTSLNINTNNKDELVLLIIDIANSSLEVNNRLHNIIREKDASSLFFQEKADIIRNKIRNLCQQLRTLLGIIFI